MIPWLGYMYASRTGTCSYNERLVILEYVAYFLYAIMIMKNRAVQWWTL